MTQEKRPEGIVDWSDIERTNHGSDNYKGVTAFEKEGEPFYYGWRFDIHLEHVFPDAIIEKMIATYRINQILMLSNVYGGIVKLSEWRNPLIPKYIITMDGDSEFHVILGNPTDVRLVAFHTMEHAELFLKYNRDLLYKYYNTQHELDRLEKLKLLEY